MNRFEFIINEKRPTLFKIEQIKNKVLLSISYISHMLLYFQK